MQQILITGNVGKDAVVRSSNGKEATYFNVCVSEKFTNGAGEETQVSTWYGCIYKRTGVAQHIKKGDKILVQGKLNPKIYINERREASLDLTVNVGLIEFLSNKPKDDATAE
jgi:single stranded DNA-binding protein